MRDVERNQRVLNEKLKEGYHNIGLLLKSCAIDEYKKMYLSVRIVKKGKVSVDIIILTKQDFYIEPLRLDLVFDIKRVLHMNVRMLAEESNKIFNALKSLDKKKIHILYYELDDKDKFKSEFIYKGEYPKKGEPSLYKALFMHRIGVPIDEGGEYWQFIEKFLETKQAKKRSSAEVKTTMHKIEEKPKVFTPSAIIKKEDLKD